MGLLFPAKGAQLRGGGEALGHLHRAEVPLTSGSHGIQRTQGLEIPWAHRPSYYPEEPSTPGVKVS